MFRATSKNKVSQFDMDKKLKILFLCTGNSCRSQMAEAWTKNLKKDIIEAYSAGIKPSHVDSRAIKVMAEAGIDMSDQYSKSVWDLMDIDFDVVITLCGHAKETCPVFPGKTMVLHRGFEDPPELAETAKNEEEVLQHYRRVRDEISIFIKEMPEVFEQLEPIKIEIGR